MRLEQCWRWIAPCRSETFERLFLIGIFLLGFALRLGYLAFIDGGAFLEERVYADDAKFYQGVGANLAAGHGYVLDGKPTAWRAPLYPFLVSLFYRVSDHPLLSLRIFHCLLGGITPLLIYAIARTLGDRGAGRLAAAACAVSYELINMNVYVMTETVYTALFLTWLLAMFRYDDKPTLPGAGLCGLLLGLLLLTRPVLLLFAAVLLPWFVWGGRQQLALRTRVLHWVGLCAVALTLVVPWIVRNSLCFGTLAPLTTETGKMIYTSHSPGATGGSGGWHVLDVDWKAPADLWSTNEAVCSRMLTSAGIQYAVSHPIETVSKMPNKFWNLWRPWMADTSRVSFILASVYYVPVVLLALYGFLTRGGYRVGVGLIYLLVCYTAILHVSLIGVVRYRYPLLPLLTLLAAFTVTTLMDRLSRERRHV